MKATELRIGNYISNQDGTLRGIPIGEPHIVNESDFKWAEMYVPIPLTEEWLLKLPEGLKYPDWIVAVHELQNWYYWNNNKKELEFINCKCENSSWDRDAGCMVCDDCNKII